MMDTTENPRYEEESLKRSGILFVVNYFTAAFVVSLLLLVPIVSAENWNVQYSGLGMASVLNSGKERRIQDLRENMTRHFTLWAGEDSSLNREEYLRVLEPDPNMILVQIAEEEKRKFVKMKLREMLEREFQATDINRDGLLSHDEFWQRPFKDISEADMNMDGVLSVDEARFYINDNLTTLKKSLREIQKSVDEMNNTNKKVLDSLKKLNENTQENKEHLSNLRRGVQALNKEGERLANKRFGNSPLRLSACAVGFQEAMHGEPKKNLRDQSSCHETSVQGFLRLIRGPHTDTPSGVASYVPELSHYDLNTDKVVTCEDFYLWKRWLADSYLKGLRRDSGESISLQECPLSDGQKPGLVE